MLAGIVLFLTIGPLTEEIFGRADGAVLMVSYTLMLIIGIWSLHATKIFFTVGLSLASLCVGLTIVNLLMPNLDLKLYLIPALFVFQCISLWIAFKFVISPGAVTLNRLMGGICVYLLLGLTWNIFYVYLFTLDPGSFAGIPDESVVKQNVYWEMTYFSFVTLTTLGYGDIQPVGRMAKVFAYAEAVAGSLYIAVLIGALVGNYMGSRQDKNE